MRPRRRHAGNISARDKSMNRVIYMYISLFKHNINNFHKYK